MAKVITENFRVINANQFYQSIDGSTRPIADNFKVLLEDYNSDNSTLLSNTNIEDITELVDGEVRKFYPENNYYIFASSVDKDTSISNTQKEKREFLRRVIFGNKIDISNARYMFTKNDWVQGTIYDSYDDDIDLSLSNFYVTILDGEINEASYKVFKCIRNNNRQPSTEKPSTANLNPNFEVISSDGYVWKYMFEVPPSEYVVFGTRTNLPYLPDEAVIAAAKESVSDIAIVSTPFELFSDYKLGAVRVNSIPQLVDVNSNQYRIELVAENQPKSSSNAYVKMYLKFTNLDFIFDIQSSNIPSNPNIDVSENRILNVFVNVPLASDEGFRNLVSPGSNCDIVPKIRISESSGENAVAWGITDATGTLIDIEFANNGSNYRFAKAELSLPNAIASQTGTVLRTIISPIGGHGSNPISELLMSKVSTVTNFFSDALNNIPSTNTYTKVGLVKNPMFRDRTYPADIDNRMRVQISGNAISDITKQNSYLYQTVNDVTLKALIHEATYDSTADTTTLYLVDYEGEADITVDYPMVVRLFDGATESDFFNINSINNVTKGNYETYSGEILHFVDFDQVERASDRREKVKFIFDF